MKKYKLNDISNIKFQVNTQNKLKKIKTDYDTKWRHLRDVEVTFSNYTKFNFLPIWVEKIITELPYISNEKEFRKVVKDIWKYWTVEIVIDCIDNNTYRFGRKEHSLNEQEYYGKQKGLFRKKWRVSFPELEVKFLNN
jgi:hypothetical protein